MQLPFPWGGFPLCIRYGRLVKFLFGKGGADPGQILAVQAYNGGGQDGGHRDVLPGVVQKAQQI